MTAKQRFLIYLLIAVINGLLWGLCVWAIAGAGPGLAVFGIVAVMTLAALSWCAAAGRCD